MDTERPAEPSTKPTGLIARTWTRHRLGLFATWIVGILVVFGLIRSQIQPTYKVLSLIRAEPITTNLYGVTTSSETFDTYLQTQIQLITSPNVLIAAGTNPNVAKLVQIQMAGDVVQELKKRVTVAVIPGTYLIEVSITSPNADEAALIVNAVVDAYLATSEEWTDGMTRSQIKSLESYLHDLVGQTEELERRWKEIASRDDRNGPIPLQAPDPGEKRRITIEQSKRLGDELFRVHLDLIQAEAWAIAVKADASKAAQTNRQKIDRIIQRRVANEPEVMALAAQMQAAQAKLDAVARTSPPDDPAVRAIRKNLDSLKGDYNVLWNHRSEKLRLEIELTSVAASQEQELREAEARVKELQVKEGALKTEVASTQIAANRHAADQVEIQLLMDQHNNLKAMQNTVQRRLEQLRYEARSATRVRKINNAVPTRKPIADRRQTLMLITPVAMGLVSFGLFLGVEAVTGSKRRPVAPAGEAAPTDPNSEVGT